MSNFDNLKHFIVEGNCISNFIFFSVWADRYIESENHYNFIINDSIILIISKANVSVREGV